MRTLGKVIVAAAVVVLGLQLIRPGIPAKPATAEVQAPAEVLRILNKNCYSCHSDERRLAWFDEIVPGYWLVRRDILRAREHLNFSTLGAKPAAVQRGALFEAVNMIQLGAMPLPQFRMLHPEARVTPEELATLKAYLAPWAAAHGVAGGEASGPDSDDQGMFASMASVQPEFNGVAFDPDFPGWEPLSITDRGDNGTFRFVLGNDIAVRAAQSGQMTPWPDGTRFAKVAWQQQAGPDGLLRAGRFIQVELMVKDASRYKSTDGWGWGRWRGLDLQPYGKDAAFVNECTGCHLPVRGDDYVYTLPITTAKVNRTEAVNNNAALLPETLPYQPLEWRPIAMYVDPTRRTISTLNGNRDAMRAVRGRVERQAAPVYPAGAVLGLVTWAERDDPHWFGGRIPDKPVSVEIVRMASAGEVGEYRVFIGAGLSESHPTGAMAAQRVNFMLSLTPAQMP